MIWHTMDTPYVNWTPYRYWMGVAQLEDNSDLVRPSTVARQRPIGVPPLAAPSPPPIIATLAFSNDVAD